MECHIHCANCCFSEHYKNPTKCIGLVQTRHHHHHLIEMKLVLTMIQLKYCSLGIKQQSLTHQPGKQRRVEPLYRKLKDLMIFYLFIYLRNINIFWLLWINLTSKKEHYLILSEKIYSWEDRYCFENNEGRETFYWTK